MRGIRWSAFDFGMIASGAAASGALRDLVDLAVRVERWGAHRFWMSEHHNQPAVATSSPGVLSAAVAAATATMRVGAGGVILPNHPPLVVAEQFGTLEALFPGRIDLGLGRAPLMDPATAAALRRVDGDFADQLAELRGYYAGGGSVAAVPGVGFRPALWLLGTGSYSAELAGVSGLPFAFGHHFNPGGTTAALASYRKHFRPSEELDRPYAMVAALVLAAASDDEAERLLGPAMVNMLCARRGEPLAALPGVDEAAAFDYTPEERDFVRGTLATQIIGGPATVRRRLTELLAASGADELMAVTITHEHDDRLRSFELLAEECES